MRQKTIAAQLTRLFHQACTYASLVRYQDALDAIDQAIALGPSALLYDYRGVLLSLLYDMDVAEESFNQALELAADSPKAHADIYFHRGLLYGQQGLFERALADLATAQRLLPTEQAYCEASASIERERQRMQSNPVLSVR